MKQRYHKHYRVKPLPVVLLILAVIVIVGGVIILFFPPWNDPNPAPASAITPTGASSGESSSEVKDVVSIKNQNGAMEKFQISEIPQGSPSDWHLILLNPDPENKIDQDLDIKMTKIDTQMVDSRAAAAYNEMKAAAKKDGIDLYLRSGYRSIETQKNNYNNSVAAYVKQGKSTEEAVKLTQQYYTVPGHSEHHTGLAFDIITPQYHQEIYELDDRFMQTDAYQWLVKNGADYGFILRYPKEKEEITKINFEPWHYRYVGVEHAKFMKKHNLCLEEYIELLKAAGR